MTRDAVKRGLPFSVAIDAKVHVDFLDRHDAIHRLHRAVAILAFDAGVDMRSMGESHKIGKCVNAVPSNLEGRFRIVGPWASYWLDSPACDSAAVTSDASRDRGDARFRRSAGVRMAVLAGNFVHSGVNAMAKWNRLDDVASRQPGTFGNGDRGDAQEYEQQSDRQHYAGEVHDRSAEESRAA
jgi:hypothetical protein